MHGFRQFQIYITLVGLLLMAGCASLGEKREPPRVSLANIKLVDLQLLEQRYLVTLRIQNPNPKELAIEGMSFELEINEQDFAYGVSADAVTVDPYAEALVDVAVVSSLFSIIDQLKTQNSRQGKPLTYRLTGKASIAGSMLTIPFERAGEFTPEPGQR